MAKSRKKQDTEHVDEKTKVDEIHETDTEKVEEKIDNDAVIKDSEDIEQDDNITANDDVVVEENESIAVEEVHEDIKEEVDEASVKVEEEVKCPVDVDTDVETVLADIDAYICDRNAVIERHKDEINSYGIMQDVMSKGLCVMVKYFCPDDVINEALNAYTNGVRYR